MRCGGRAVLVVKVADSKALLRASRRSEKTSWTCSGTTSFASGGIDVFAVRLVKGKSDAGGKLAENARSDTHGET